ncbi:hypothetical protein [Amycolatopsis thailandensis]|uniref:hypothetical protein n=1 Tax=Amycolatopsis thailandensis TaxID=589330 RepID=UPI0026C33779
MNRHRKPITALFAAVFLLGGCSETISGTASPVPGQGPVLTKAAPCSLLTPGHADAIASKLPGGQPDPKIVAPPGQRKPEPSSLKYCTAAHK